MTIFAGIMGYIALQLVIGAVVSRRVHTNEDYLLAGRNLGYGMGTLTIFATWFGAESCIGSAGQAYDRGVVAGEVDPFGYALCLVVMGLFFAARYWNGHFLTMGDLFKRRYSTTVEWMSVALLVPTSMIWSAAQLRAFGQVLASAVDISVTTGISIAIVVTLLYTVAGGMWADAVTDMIQGLMMIAGLVILFVLVLMNNDGFELWERVPNERWQLFPANDGRPWYVVVNAWAIPVLNAVVAQELVARMLASRSATIARNNCFLAGGLYFVVGSIPFLLGIVGPVLVPDLAESEQILPTLARTYMNDFAYVLFIGAVIAAMLSTIDSSLLVSASLMANNLWKLPATASERARLRWSRLWVLLLGISAYLITFGSDSVFELAQEASSLGASGLFIVVVFGLMTRFGGAWSAIVAMMVGLGTYLLAENVFAMPAGFLLSLLAALVGYVVVALFETPTPGMHDSEPDNAIPNS